MTVLDILAKQAADYRLQTTENKAQNRDQKSLTPNIELVVAHFNHGIRPDSHKDEDLVRAVAAGYGLLFETARGRLGKQASEETARSARYAFLKATAKKHNAKAIITAHHQDDLIETALINLLRGSGRRGLVSLALNSNVRRPLLGWTKEDILKYARQNGLKWREDDSNRDETILRNYIRRRIMPRLSEGERQSIVNNLDKIAALDSEINLHVAKLSQKITKDGYINRRAFTALPVDLGNEMVLFWLRQRSGRQPDKKTVRRLNLALRASRGGSDYPVDSGLDLSIGKATARFSNSL